MPFSGGEKVKKSLHESNVMIMNPETQTLVPLSRVHEALYPGLGISVIK